MRYLAARYGTAPFWSGDDLAGQISIGGPNGQRSTSPWRSRCRSFGSLIYAEAPQRFHARNPFPLGGVYEDPATGAAAAALAGYLRELGWPHGGAIEVIQGEDMGVPSRLCAEITAEPGASIRVSGDARLIA